MTAAQARPEPEFSRPLSVERLGSGWQAHRLVADETERAALATRFGLQAVASLDAEVRVRRGRGGRYVEVEGSLRAAVTQTCVVTLEPAPAALDERFELLLGPIGGPSPDAGRTGAGDLIVDLDDPEPFEGDSLDLGEIVAQQLSLALDPYPRAPGVGPGAGEGAYGGEEAPEPPAESPFAVLAKRRPSE